MIPTIKQVMKCYRVIAQIERMKTGRPGPVENWVAGQSKCNYGQVKCNVV